MSAPPEDDDSRRSRGNIAALIAVIALALLGYWAFTAIEKQRELQKCVAEGRRDCLNLTEPGK
ncbi:MAG: hypothetical protein JO288_22815 [Hyphomicrobiales bacterium]|nr:hypothetical protein [Hyphomicrobiales bacterium]